MIFRRLLDGSESRYLSFHLSNSLFLSVAVIDESSLMGIDFEVLTAGAGDWTVQIS